MEKSVFITGATVNTGLGIAEKCGKCRKNSKGIVRKIWCLCKGLWYENL